MGANPPMGFKSKALTQKNFISINKKMCKFILEIRNLWMNTSYKPQT